MNLFSNIIRDDEFIEFDELMYNVIHTNGHIMYIKFTSMYINMQCILCINVNQYASIYINIHQYTSIYINMQCILCINVNQYASIYINMHQYTSIYINMHQCTLYIVQCKMYINIIRWRHCIYSDRSHTEIAKQICTKKTRLHTRNYIEVVHL